MFVLRYNNLKYYIFYFRLHLANNAKNVILELNKKSNKTRLQKQ